MTLLVRATVHIAGLRPGEEVDVEDGEYVRDLLDGKLLVLVAEDDSDAPDAAELDAPPA